MLVSTGLGIDGPLKNTEVLNLDSKNALVPTYQNHKTSIYGAIGGFVSNQFITCGGYDFDNWEGTTNKCYKIGKTSSSLHGFMREKRKHAASIVLDGKLWILGGRNDYIYNSWKSTEYISHDGSQEDGPDLPVSLDDHAAIQINGTHFMVVGGHARFDVKMHTNCFFSRHMW